MLQVNQLVGFGVGDGELIAFINSDVSNSDATAVPSGAGVGDLVIAIGWARKGTSGPNQAVLANGWSEAFYVVRSGPNSNNYALRAIYKRLTGTGDTGQELFDSETHTTTISLAFSSVGSGATLGDAKGSINSSGSNLASQTTSASTGTPPLVVIGVEAIAQQALFSTTLTPAMDGSVSGSNAGASGGQMNLRASYKLYAEAPANHTVDSPSGLSGVPAQGIFYMEMG